ncbi:conserved hypothetical protein [Methylocella tundrae]|uniref:Methyltransferase FkbM domain-containing protein n=1 Tax=Methylocella tundrae TaxID=227605 RepID=A0A8B6M088_METTU|nr:FkbM family methyltransferase [Methylocella tundrae]VTZ27433.1 conserved hypothetical protein [Methylocella tundrae]VTZ48447.1 conserved hypothetical protein [Methylocella tundrae]
MAVAKALNPVNWLKFFQETVVFGPSMWLRGILPRNADGVVSINSRVGRISLRPSDSDINVLRQVFVYKDYDFDKFTQCSRIYEAYQAMIDAGRTPVIIDAGANIGAVSLWFARRFPKAKIVAIEPDPATVAVCRLNCAQYENIRVVEGAIGGGNGMVTLERPSHESWAVQTKRESRGNIQLFTVDALLEMAGIAADLLIVKIDIEGFESDLFASNTSWMPRAAVIVIELHDWLLPGRYTSVTFQKAIGLLHSEVLISGENLVFIK